MEKSNQTDSLIEYLLKFNESHPVYYFGRMIPIGALKPALDQIQTEEAND
jgi:hypothetical protein